MTTCYRLQNGTIQQLLGLKPCTEFNTAGNYTHCCGWPDTCIADDLCWSGPGAPGSAGQYLGSCSDPTYQDSSCSQHCVSYTKGDVTYNSTTGLYTCCGTDSKGNPNCEDPTTESFSGPNIVSLVDSALAASTATGSSPTTASLSSTTTTSPSSSGATNKSSTSPTGSLASASSTPQSSSSSSSHGLSGGAIAGIVIGVLVAVALLSALAFWFGRKGHRRGRAELPANHHHPSKPELSSNDTQSYEPKSGTTLVASGDQTPRVGHDIGQRGPPRLELSSMDRQLYEADDRGVLEGYGDGDAVRHEMGDRSTRGSTL